jgi:radical SAM protein with 4Fe4S-binding SPASM domain
MVVYTDTNLHKIAGKSVVERGAARYREYRKKWNSPGGEVPDFPLHIDLEPTSACNLKCPFCATTYNAYKKGYMPEDMWKRILDECGKERLYSLKFTFRGEPLMHPHLVDMVRYAKRAGIMDIYLNTNATLLNGIRAKELIDAGLDRISISFEGYDEKTYQKYRVGSRFERTVEHIRNLKKLQVVDEMGVPRPLIRIQSVLVPEMVGHTKEYAEFWEPYADEVAYLDMKREANNPDHKGSISEWGCPFLWQRLTIAYNGNILMCPHDIYEWEVLGSVGGTTIKDAWLGAMQTRNRKLHSTGQAHLIHACDRCPLRALEIDKLEGKFK